MYSMGAYYGIGNHMTEVMLAPKLPVGLLYEWIVACLVCFSVGFGKLGMTMYILEVQDRTYKWGKYILLGAVGVNVSELLFSATHAAQVIMEKGS